MKELSVYLQVCEKRIPVRSLHVMKIDWPPIVLNRAFACCDNKVVQ